MRTLRFAKVAAEAERLRLQYMLRRYVTRAILAGVAAVFLVAMVAMLHLAAWQALITTMAPPLASLVLVGADLLLALVFGLVALNSGPSPAEREARALRNTAALQLARPGPVLGLLVERLLRLLVTRIFARAR